MLNASDFQDVADIRMVVFDIDGTLANTAELVPTGQRRKPDDFLKLHGPSDVRSNLTRFPNVRRLTSNLNRCGIRVAVITDAPKAYAGTVCYLLGVEAGTIIAHNNLPGLKTKADRLRWLANETIWQYLSESPSPRIDVSNILYIGDLPVDQAAAAEAGCRYQHVESYLDDQGHHTPLSKLEAMCESLVNNTLSIDLKSELWQARCCGQRIDHQNEVIQNLTSRNFFIDMTMPELMLDPDGLPGVFNTFKPDSAVLRPLLDPSFITREEYDHDKKLKSELFDALATEYSAKSLDLKALNHPNLTKTKVFAHLKYWDSHLGQNLWKHIKNWQYMESGPEANLFHLEFIALFMAATIWSQHELDQPQQHPPIIVPVPSSPYSASKPARVSNRLAQRIAELTDLRFVELLEKQDGLIRLVEGRPTALHSAILIDDQLTHGTSAEKCLTRLNGSVESVELHVWTSKHFDDVADSSVLLPTLEVESRAVSPRVGQRVHTARFGLGRIVLVKADSLMVDFNTFGIKEITTTYRGFEYLD